MRIYDQVKKGDILLVPRLPEWERVAIVEAVEDFDKGYRFEIDDLRGDFGHCFPAKMLCSFTRFAGVVSGDIRTTLRYRGRFWNIDWYREDIEIIRESEENLRTQSRQPTQGLLKAVQEVLEKLRKDLYNLLDRDYEGKDWESILKEVLTAIYPNYLVESVGGRSESLHGTDILISVPGIGAGSDYEYAIAIQVKDQTSLTEDAVRQIQAAPDYWKKTRGLRFVDRCIVVTRAAPDSRVDVNGVKIIWAEELKKIIEEYARRTVPTDRG